ncbi:MAG TPA: hypothetical protein VEG27_10390 [Usitatibacter sp.]|nr:hypothetical protein [Usitatibacter sp.]
MGTGNAYVKPGRAWAACIAAAAFALLAAGGAQAQVPGQKTVDGVVFDVGIASAAQISALPPGSLGAEAPGPSEKGKDHLVVALSEAASGQRIVNARVTVNVARMGMDGVRRTLERMDVAGATSWGGYFDLHTPGSYRIHLVAILPGRAPVVADFEYRNE